MPSDGSSSRMRPGIGRSATRPDREPAAAWHAGQVCRGAAGPQRSARNREKGPRRPRRRSSSGISALDRGNRPRCFLSATVQPRKTRPRPCRHNSRCRGCAPRLCAGNALDRLTAIDDRAAPWAGHEADQASSSTWILPTNRCGPITATILAFPHLDLEPPASTTGFAAIAGPRHRPKRRKQHFPLRMGPAPDRSRRRARPAIDLFHRKPCAKTWPRLQHRHPRPRDPGRTEMPCRASIRQHRHAVRVEAAAPPSRPVRWVSSRRHCPRSARPSSRKGAAFRLIAHADFGATCFWAMA